MQICFFRVHSALWKERSNNLFFVLPLIKVSCQLIAGPLRYTSSQDLGSDDIRLSEEVQQDGTPPPAEAGQTTTHFDVACEPGVRRAVGESHR